MACDCTAEIADLQAQITAQQVQIGEILVEILHLQQRQSDHEFRLEVLEPYRVLSEESFFKLLDRLVAAGVISTRVLYQVLQPISVTGETPALAPTNSLIGSSLSETVRQKT